MDNWYGIFCGVMTCLVFFLAIVIGALISKESMMDSCNMTGVVVIERNVYECKLRNTGG